MAEFTASNGMPVERDHNNDVLIGRGTETMSVFMADGTALALREFFQHERDNSLGRWRWPENPDYVVYPSHLWQHPANLNQVYVTNETNGQGHRAHREDTDRLFGFFSEAARAYFDAHPERKPWDDAKDGEVWMLRGDDHPDEARAYIVVEGRFFSVPPKRPVDPGWKPAAFASTFTSGERFWPEVTP